MSDEDQEKWKAKLRYTKTDHPQVEIRKTVYGAQLLIIVGLNGWTYKHESPQGSERHGTRINNTEDYHVRMSVNGPMWWHWPDFLDLIIAVHEARKVLGALDA